MLCENYIHDLLREKKKGKHRKLIDEAVRKISTNCQKKADPARARNYGTPKGKNEKLALPDCKYPLKLITLENIQHMRCLGAEARNANTHAEGSYVIQQRVTHENLKIMLVPQAAVGEKNFQAHVSGCNRKIQLLMRAASDQQVERMK